MTPTKMRNTLIGALAVSIIAAGALVYFATDMLSHAVAETTHRQIDAELRADELSSLHSLASVLEQNQQAVQKAAQIVSDSKQYQYQDQIIRDVNSYARQTDITVTGYNFGETESGSSSRSVSGVKSIPVTVNLESPMPYRNYLQFTKLLEQNISKMQVTGISLSPDSDNLNLVTNPSVGLIVYVR